MMRTFFIARDELAQAFKSPRAVRSFEEMQEKVAETDTAVGANIEATTRLSDASFLTLSPNAELQNEYVLRLGDGLRFDVTEGSATLITDAPVVPDGYRVRLLASADSELVLPIAGVLATRANPEVLSNKTLDAPSFSGLGNYADDASAAAGGVPIGGAYRNGSALMVRVA